MGTLCFLIIRIIERMTFYPVIGKVLWCVEFVKEICSIFFKYVVCCEMDGRTLCYFVLGRVMSYLF